MKHASVTIFVIFSQFIFRSFLSLVTLIFTTVIFTTTAYAATYTVTKTADTNDGTCNSDCSLREAVVVANSNSGADVIEFNIPTSDGGYVAPSGDTQGYFSLPVSTIILTDDNGVFINGYSQPGASRNTAVFGQTINTILKIQIIYSYSTTFTFSGDNNHMAGLNYHATTVHTVDLDINDSSNNWVEGNFFGSNITGTVTQIGGTFRIRNGASNNTIGTNGDGIDDAGERNLFMGSVGKDYAFAGYVSSDNSDNAGENNVIAGNYLGPDKTGRVCTNAIAYGMDVALASSNNRIGTNFDGISDSEESNIMGCVFVDPITRGFIRLYGNINNNLIQGNYLGVSPHGDTLGSLAGTGMGGVSLLGGGANGNIIKGNTITGADYGILQLYSGRNTFSQNKIYGTAILGIGLGSSTSILVNDSGDLDTGQNDLMNYPNIQNAEHIGGGNYHIHGNLDGQASEGPFTIEVCISSGDSSGHGGCSRYLGSTTINTPGTWDLNVYVAGDNDQNLSTFTSLATNANGSTSEFSSNVRGIVPHAPSNYSIRIPEVRGGIGGIAHIGDIVSIVPPKGFKYDAYLWVDTAPQPGAFRIPGTLYWQVSPTYNIWWKADSNDARILPSEVGKSYILSFHYDLTRLPKGILERNQKVAFSSDGKRWKILPGSILDFSNKTISIVTKSGGYYILVSAAKR